MKALSPGYFGPTKYDGLTIRIDKIITNIKVKCLNSKPEYLNLKEILIFGQDGLLNENIILDGKVEQSSIYSKHSEVDTHAILQGKGTHTLKEIEPWIELKFDPSYVHSVQILNRPDIWGKRSKNLIVQTLSPNKEAEWELAFDANSDEYACSIFQQVIDALKPYISGPELKSITDNGSLISILAAHINDGKIPFKDFPWPLALKLVNIWSEKPSAAEVSITAAFLATQNTLGYNTSFHNLANPYMSESIIDLLGMLDRYKKFDLNIPDLKSLIQNHANKSKEKNAWLDMVNYTQMLLALNPDNPEFLFNLGLGQEKRGNHDEARASYSKALKNSKATTPLHNYLFSSTHESIQCRIELGSFIQKNFQAIKSRAKQRPSSNKDACYKIFSYWAQGLDNAPPIVKACHRQMLKHHAAQDIVYLDDTNFRYYVDIPKPILDSVFDNKTFFSDVLRFYLLEKYGGVWMDSTCYLTSPLDIASETLNKQRLTAFRRANKNRISVWFFAASKQSWIVKLIREALTEYWSNYDYVIDYFMLHHIFEILYFLDAEFRQEWDSHEQPLTSEAHQWYFSMNEEFNLKKYQEICAASNIHKLTYKVDSKIKSSDTFYSFAIRGFN